MAHLSKLIDGVRDGYRAVNEWFSEECPRCKIKEIHTERGFSRTTTNKRMKTKLRPAYNFFTRKLELQTLVCWEHRIQRTCPRCSHTWEVTEDKFY